VIKLDDLRMDHAAVINIGVTYNSLTLVRLLMLEGTVPFREFLSSRLLPEEYIQKSSPIPYLMKKKKNDSIWLWKTYRTSSD